jgi:hypothetical protein
MRPAVPYLFAALAFLLVYAGLAKTKRADLRSFWDARIYAVAIHDYRAGLDPYAPSPDAMDFVYPPIFLQLGALPAKVVPSVVAWPLYLTLLVVAICSIPWTLITAFVGRECFPPLMVCVLFVLEPKLYAETALMTGNVATLLYGGILLAAIPGLRRNRWTMFYLVVIVAALIKLPFLTLLAFSWLAGHRQFWRSSASALVVVAGYAAQWLFDRRLFLDFLKSVKRQVLDGGDTGLGVLAMFLKMGKHIPAMRGSGAMLASVAVIAGMLAFLGVLKRFRNLPGVAEVWLPTALVASILSNPRMMLYDADIAIVPGIFLFVQWARSLPATAYRSVWIAIPPSIFLLVFSIGPATAVFLLLFGSMLLILSQIVAAARRTEGAVLTGQGALAEDSLNEQGVVAGSGF